MNSTDISNKENHEILIKHEAPEEVQFSLKPELKPPFKAKEAEEESVEEESGEEGFQG
jgi:hypothetical protein